MPVDDDVLAEIRGARSPERENETRTGDLRAELESLEARIGEVDAELENASDVRDVARRFVDALTEHVEAVAHGPTAGAGHEPAADSYADELTGVDASATSGTDDASSRNGDGPSSGGDAEDAFAAFGAMMGGDDESQPNRDSVEGDDGLAALAGVGDDSGGERGSADVAGQTASRGGDTMRAVSDGGLSVRSFSTELAEFEGGAAAIEDGEAATAGGDGRPAVVTALEETLAGLDDVALELLSLYRAEGPETPADAYHAVTGRQDRVGAYSVNRALRRAGLVEHVGRGHYDYCLGERIEAGLPENRDEGMASVYARDLEQQFLD